MEKKKYELAKLEVILLTKADIITASSGWEENVDQDGWT